MYKTASRKLFSVHLIFVWEITSTRSTSNLTLLGQLDLLKRHLFYLSLVPENNHSKIRVRPKLGLWLGLGGQSTVSPRYMQSFLSAIWHICNWELIIFLEPELYFTVIIWYFNIQICYMWAYFWSLSLTYNKGHLWVR